ncbi:Endogenous retrovirus group 3 member 1 Env polyprotein [Plecturocebus cupreus]
MPCKLILLSSPFSPGDRVWIKDWNVVPLKPRWKGPWTMILTTPIAIKVDRMPIWIHHSLVKPEADETWEARPDPDNNCRITLRRTTSLAPATSQKLAGTLTDFGECFRYYECTGTKKGTCLYSGTQYKVCSPGDGQPNVCCDPSEPPMHTAFEIKLITGRWNNTTKLIAKTEEKRNPKQVTLRFDACAAINAYHSRWGAVVSSDGNKVMQMSIRRDTIPWGNVPCVSRHCNPVELIITNPQEPKREKGVSVKLGIDGKGLDPGVSIQIQGKIQKHSSQPVYQTFYDILNEPVPELPKKSKNLFLQLSENVAHSFNVTSCYVCGGTTMGDRWPWEARELVLSDPIPDLTSVQRIQTSSVWVLKVSITGQYCLTREGKDFTVPVGKLSCLGQQLYNGTVDTVTWMLGTILGIGETGRPRLGCTGHVDMEHMYNCLKDGQAGHMGRGWLMEIPDFIYMLNRIIQLQAVLEMLTNETGKALSLLA